MMALPAWLCCWWWLHSLAASSNNIAQVSEGALSQLVVSSTLAGTPGSGAPGFYNPRRCVGRDLVVLSVAQWLIHKTNNIDGNKMHLDGSVDHCRILDAHCASGVQGLRVAVEAPQLAQAYHLQQETTTDLPSCQVVLNDVDPAALHVAARNVDRVLQQSMFLPDTATVFPVSLSQRRAEALLYDDDKPFDITILDPFGSTTPCLDAAMARAPHGGRVELCATDVTALYGSRPNVARRHYHGAHLSSSSPLDNKGGRPPCFRERGLRLLLAEVAYAAARHDKGILPLYAVSHQHTCCIGIRMIRGGRAADAAIDQVRLVSICSNCGTATIVHDHDCPDNTANNDCGCFVTHQNANNLPRPNGPLWVGRLHDPSTIRTMTDLAHLPMASSWVGRETRTLLSNLQQEAAVDALFYRRPNVPGTHNNKHDPPKLEAVIRELQRRGYAAARTHMDSRAIKSTASPQEFDQAVQDVVQRRRRQAKIGKKM